MSSYWSALQVFERQVCSLRDRARNLALRWLALNSGRCQRQLRSTRTTGCGRELRFPQVSVSCPWSCQLATRTAANGRRCEFTLPAMSGRTAERNRSTQMTGPWGRADTMPSAGVGSTSFEAVVEASGATAGGKHSRNDRYLPTRTSATDPSRTLRQPRTDPSPAINLRCSAIESPRSRGEATFAGS